MPKNEKKENEVVDETKTAEDAPVEEKEETKTAEDSTKEQKEEETKSIGNEEKEEETKTEEKSAEETSEEPKEEEQPVVEQTMKKTSDGLTVDDIMTKDDFNARFAALEAKFDALANENNQLKEQNAQLLEGKTRAEEETQGLKNKYENTSFGNYGKNGEVKFASKEHHYESFDEYSSKFGK